jgi:hypothetical protein
MEERPEHSQSSAEVSPHLNSENHSNINTLPLALSPKAVLSISNAVFLSLKQNLMQMRYSSHYKIVDRT